MTAGTVERERERGGGGGKEREGGRERERKRENETCTGIIDKLKKGGRTREGRIEIALFPRHCGIAIDRLFLYARYYSGGNSGYESQTYCAILRI